MKMKKKYFLILILLSYGLLFSSINTLAQDTRKDNKITIESVVKDDNGNPIPGASVYGNEGSAFTKTDAEGKFSISVPDLTDLYIESYGFESALFKPGEYKNLKELKLKASKFLYGQNDDVHVAFGTVKQGNLVNSVSMIDPDEILQYDNIQEISEALSGRVPGMLGSSNIRGIGVPLYIVDGLPRDISTINLAEVEQITVLKDVNSSLLYGNSAVNGVVLITTKRGQVHKKQINVTGFYGIDKPRALPKYLSSTDFMTLFNEARTNDGLTPLYSQIDIDNYASGNKYRYPNVDYYSSEYLKSIKPFSKVMAELSGGNELATYYSNIGWYNTGSLLDFGEGKNAGQNKFNIRGNVDFKINDWISNSLDAVAVFDNEKGPVGNYWSESSTLRPNLFAPLLPFDLIPPDNALLKSRKNDVNDMYLLGGTTSYLTNPIANGFSGGVTELVRSTFSFNDRINIDLNKIVQGLSFHTNVSFDLFTRYNQSITNNYSVYSPVWEADVDSIQSITQLGSDTRTGTQNISNQYFERRFGFYGVFNYDRTFNDMHWINGTLLGYGSLYKIQGDFQGNKNVNMGLRLMYGYKSKYLVDFSSAYVNSVKLPDGNRGAFSPSLGLAWVISSEDFMSGISAIDYLKIRISGGILNSDAGIGGFYYYDDSYQSSSGYSWFDGTWSNSGLIASQSPNNKLGFEKRSEFNLGFNGIFFERKLSVDANIFKSSYYDQITRPVTMFPSYFTTFAPYQNYDNNSYKGAELGLKYTVRTGDWSFVLGANSLYSASKVVKKDEIYSEKYQYRAGRPLYARFGLVAEGLFNDQADIANHAVQAFGNVQPGDIKYVDQNNDGIVDSNDEVEIGLSQTPFYYGLNLRISYKNITLYAQGTGSAGSDSYISGNYYWVDGNDKYSEFILNRWTPEAIVTSTTFPRLSSLSNSNNFRNSTYWLYKDNYFSISRVQLTYYMPDVVTKKLNMKNMSVFVDGSSLLLVSRHRAIKDLSVGSEPYYRSFSLGLKTMF